MCAAENIRVSSTTFTQSAQKAIEFGNIKQPLGLLRRSRSFNVTNFGTNRKFICDFLLVINITYLTQSVAFSITIQTYNTAVSLWIVCISCLYDVMFVYELDERRLIYLSRKKQVHYGDDNVVIYDRRCVDNTKWQ